MAKKKHKKGKVIEYSKLERKVAALWTRVSSVDQEKHGCGLEFQDKICREYAAKNNIIIKRHSVANTKAQRQRVMDIRR